MFSCGLFRAQPRQPLDAAACAGDTRADACRALLGTCSARRNPCNIGSIAVTIAASRRWAPVDWSGLPTVVWSGLLTGNSSDTNLPAVVWSGLLTGNSSDPGFPTVAVAFQLQFGVVF